MAKLLNSLNRFTEEPSLLLANSAFDCYATPAIRKKTRLQIRLTNTLEEAVLSGIDDAGPVSRDRDKALAIEVGRPSATVGEDRGGSRRLGDLADPSKFHSPVCLNGWSPEELLSFLKGIIRIRRAETKLAEMRRFGKIGGPVHLGIGQEAVAVGVSSNLLKTDKVFGGHRSHSHILALGASMHKLFAEIMGKDTGHSRGMGGSMHLRDESVGFCGSVPIVAGTVPLAVGAGLAAKFDGRNGVAVAYLGDGAVEEGVVHESLNLASQLRLPVVFVVENNLYASHMHLSLRQPADSIARFATANEIPSEVIDGNNVVEVARAAKRMVDGARGGNGPGFLEAVTYRWLGHVDWRDDVDVGVNRSRAEIEAWKGRDPLKRLSEAMLTGGILTPSALASVESEIEEEISEAWKQAETDPFPPAGALLDRVYA